MYDIDWTALAHTELTWIALAFGLGLAFRTIGLPPMVGYLAAGFILNLQGMRSSPILDSLADLGITLLLFTIGLKLNVRTLARPQVWAVTGLHGMGVILLLGLCIQLLAAAGTPIFTDVRGPTVLLIAFALSFSSTVFVAKSLEDKGEMRSLHGRVAIGILIMQDILAVGFLAASAGKLPTPWALILVFLLPAKQLFWRLLTRLGHGELLVLYGFLLALGSARLFEFVGLKGDLGALVLGMLLASHPRSAEMAKTMLSFKDLFLLGFFLSIGLSGDLTVDTLIAGTVLVPLVLVKAALFFALLVHFQLRARTSLMATVNLTNYSEFGLIVAAVAVTNGWLDERWLLVLSIALALSFLVAAVFVRVSHPLYARYRHHWRRLQRRERLPDDRVVDVSDATIAVVGMGRVGTGAYDRMRAEYGDTVIGIDSDALAVERHRDAGREVIIGDPTDADFWDRVEASSSLSLVMLALPSLQANLAALRELQSVGVSERVATIARYADEIPRLLEAGATTVYNVYTEAGSGFAGHVIRDRPAIQGSL